MSTKEVPVNLTEDELDLLLQLLSNYANHGDFSSRAWAEIHNVVAKLDAAMDVF